MGSVVLAHVAWEQWRMWPGSSGACVVHVALMCVPLIHALMALVHRTAKPIAEEEAGWSTQTMIMVGCRVGVGWCRE